MNIGNEVQTNRDVVTVNESKGQCERFNARPSQRQRIIIARSQEQQFRNTDRHFSQKLNNIKPNLANTFNQNDSIMSGGAIKPNHHTIQNASFSAYKPGTAGVTGPSIQTIGFVDVQS